MARIAHTNQQIAKDDYSSTSLARYEDANVEALRKRYVEEMKTEDLPVDQRSVEEIQASIDAQAINFLNEFLELEEDVYVDPDIPCNSWKDFSSQVEEQLQDLFSDAHLQREQISEEEAADRIEQVETFTVNDKDPFLEESFKLKSERIIKKISIAKEQEKAKETTTSDPYYQSSRMHSTSGDPFGAKTYYENTARKTTAETTQTFHASSGNRDLYNKHVAKTADQVRNTVVNGPRWSEETAKPVYHFSGKGRFRLRHLVTRTKQWFNSKKGRRTFKIGIAICIETALAVVTNQMQFEGAGQTLGYIGMMLGLFYISSELFAEGYDPRRLAMI